MDNNTSSMREDFEAAIEESGMDEVELKNEIILPDEPEQEETLELEETEVAEVSEDAETTETTPVAAETTPVEGETETPETTVSDIKAPLGFSPASREEWDKVPQVVKEQIAKREAGMAEAMANTKAAKTTHNHLNKLANNFAPILAAEGVTDPMQAVEGLFNTVAELRMGSPAQKAAKIGDLISQYGVDIGMLDQALTGQAPADTQETQFASIIDQKLAPINQIMEQLNQIQAGKQQESTAAVNQEVANFTQTAEFINEVRNDMADLIDMASSRGQNLSLQDAYDKACMFNSEVSTVLARRKEAEALTQQKNSLEAKRRAGSSVAGTRAGVVTSQPNSLRAQIEKSWDQALDG